MNGLHETCKPRGTVCHRNSYTGAFSHPEACPAKKGRTALWSSVLLPAKLLCRSAGCISLLPLLLIIYRLPCQPSCPCCRLAGFPALWSSVLLPAKLLCRSAGCISLLPLLLIIYRLPCQPSCPCCRLAGFHHRPFYPTGFPVCGRHTSSGFRHPSGHPQRLHTRHSGHVHPLRAS